MGSAFSRGLNPGSQGSEASGTGDGGGGGSRAGGLGGQPCLLRMNWALRSSTAASAVGGYVLDCPRRQTCEAGSTGAMRDSRGAPNPAQETGSFQTHSIKHPTLINDAVSFRRKTAHPEPLQGTPPPLPWPDTHACTALGVQCAPTGQP